MVTVVMMGAGSCWGLRGDRLGYIGPCRCTGRIRATSVARLLHGVSGCGGGRLWGGQVDKLQAVATLCKEAAVSVFLPLLAMRQDITSRQVSVEL